MMKDIAALILLDVAIFTGVLAFIGTCIRICDWGAKDMDKHGHADEVISGCICTEWRDVSESDMFTVDEAYSLFEATAQRYMKMSGAEFLRLWDSHKLTDPEVSGRAMRVAALIPLVRKISARKNPAEAIQHFQKVGLYK